MAIPYYTANNVKNIVWGKTAKSGSVFSADTIHVQIICESRIGISIV